MLQQEGTALLGDDELGKTRGQTQQQAEESTKTPEKPKVPRDSTMVVTAKASITICKIHVYSVSTDHPFYRRGHKLLAIKSWKRHGAKLERKM